MTTMYRLLAKTALLAWAAFACHAQSADPRDRPSGPPSAPAATITGPSGNTAEVQGPPRLRALARSKDAIARARPRLRIRAVAIACARELTIVKISRRQPGLLNSV